MNAEKIDEIILKAIKEKLEVELKVKHGLGDIIESVGFHPYIAGDDAFQHPFVWGYLIHNMTFYKFSFKHILSAKLTTSKFSVSNEACYQYSLDEDHSARIDGFKNIYSEAARLNE